MSNNPGSLKLKDKEAIEKRLSELKELVEDRLKTLFDSEKAAAPEICKAMDYSLQAGGKRLRPVLCLTAAEMLGKDAKDALDVACALELVHTYSLIHDDLPAMDDDDFRRNKPTSHKVFGEGVAILAGDALLTFAFELLARLGIKRDNPLATLLIINELANAAGYNGMIGGQVLDLAAEDTRISVSEMEAISRYKTGALLRASVKSGVFIAGCREDSAEIASLTRYAGYIGLAFQIADDLLNIEGDPEKMGKGAGTDKEKGKATYPLHLGKEAAEQKLNQLYVSALKELDFFKEKADTLRYLTHKLIYRDY